MFLSSVFSNGYDLSSIQSQSEFPEYVWDKYSSWKFKGLTVGQYYWRSENPDQENTWYFIHTWTQVKTWQIYAFVIKFTDLPSGYQMFPCRFPIVKQENSSSFLSLTKSIWRKGLNKTNCEKQGKCQSRLGLTTRFSALFIHLFICILVYPIIAFCWLLRFISTSYLLTM